MGWGVKGALWQERYWWRVQNFGLQRPSVYDLLRGSGATHPADAILKEPMEDMLPSQYRMPDHSPQKVLQQPLPPSNDGRILLGLGLTFDCIVGDGLLGRDRRNDEYGVEPGQGLMKGQEGRVAPPRRVGLCG